jgi:uridine kinase
MSHTHPYIIGITGGSASGKTTFLRKLAEAFGEDQLCIVSQDNYYKSIEDQVRDENGHVNYDLPSCIDFEKFVADLDELKKGKSITKKEYTFNNPNKEPEIITINPAPIIVTEGLFIFYHREIFERLQLKIFIDAEEQIKYERRIKRDIDERGIASDMVVYQWNNHVKPAYEKYLLPFIHQTDLVILNNNGFNKGFEVVADHIFNLLERNMR